MSPATYSVLNLSGFLLVLAEGLVVKFSSLARYTFTQETTQKMQIGSYLRLKVHF